MIPQNLFCKSNEKDTTLAKIIYMVSVTANQYAVLRGLHPAGGAIRKAIKLGHNLPGVEKLCKFGKSHQLWVSEDFYRRNKKRLKKVA